MIENLPRVMVCSGIGAIAVTRRERRSDLDDADVYIYIYIYSVDIYVHMHAKGPGPSKERKDSRGVRLEAVGDTSQQDATAEAVEEWTLPALLLVLLAGLDAEQPTGRGVVLRSVV